MKCSTAKGVAIMVTAFKKSAVFIALLAIWQIGCNFAWWNTYILPTPQKVLMTFWKLTQSGQLLEHIGISFGRILIGFLISILIGVPLGLLFGLHTKLYTYFKGLFEFIRHTPPLALVPILILWFGIGEKTKIIIIVLASLFPILMSTMSGVRSCDPKLVEVGKSFKLTYIEIFKKIIFPAAVPQILVGMTLAFGYSWRAIIGAEMIAASAGLGYMILDGQQLSRPDVVIVGILVIGILGALTDLLFEKITKPFMKGRDNVDER